jgi:hypothetical protein
MSQLSTELGLSGADGADSPSARFEGELGGDAAGEVSWEETGGEGGSVGRSLWRELIWRMVGRAGALESCVLVNGCYYASGDGRVLCRRGRGAYQAGPWPWP